MVETIYWLGGRIQIAKCVAVVLLVMIVSSLVSSPYSEPAEAQESQGPYTWVRQFGSDEDEWDQKVAVDPDDNVYVAGSTNGEFNGSINMGYDDVF